jgi:hypothetical protein
MPNDKIVDLIEMYSNAILGFVVAQSIAFSISFGTSASFSCEFVHYKTLSLGVAIHFILVSVLSSVAITRLSEHIRSRSTENQDLVRTL